MKKKKIRSFSFRGLSNNFLAFSWVELNICKTVTKKEGGESGLVLNNQKGGIILGCSERNIPLYICYTYSNFEEFKLHSSCYKLHWREA